MKTGTLIHYSKVIWDRTRWQNFMPIEFACPCCGEMCWDPGFYDHAQDLRNRLGEPMTNNSAHRCIKHNREVGGAANSAHLKNALDIPFERHGAARLFKHALDAGFTTFGFYSTFVHMDLRDGRRWVGGGGALELWRLELSARHGLREAARVI